MKKKLTESIGKIFSRCKMKVAKHSPEILVIGGIVGTVAAAVMACKATTKVDSIMQEKKEKLSAIRNCTEDTDIEEYTQEDAKKDTVIVYVQTGMKLVKLYSPAVMLGLLSITSILASNNILRKRNIALTAAYSAVHKGFKEYRSRVVERFGDAVDKELRYDIKAHKIEETVTDDNGREISMEKTVDIAHPDVISEYARFFDESCAYWEKDSEYNLYFLKSRQQLANDMLVSRGYIFLNEIYDMLGIPKTKAGQIVGWVYDEKNPVGDNYVDFGIYDINREKARDFVNGYERVILLDFNVDGNILDRM